MDFRHFFIGNKFTDLFYLNCIRPIGYLFLLYPQEMLQLHMMKKKYLYLKKFKGKYEHKRCFIIGTGPSLQQQDLELVKDEILFGVNGLCLWKNYIKYINYFFISDPLAFKKLRNDLPESTFISSYVIRKCSELDSSKFCEIPVSRFNNFSSKIKRWSNDISKVFYDYHSVVFLAIQFAIYAGFDEIYLLGVDCNYNTENLYANAVDHGIRQKKEYIQDNGLIMIKDFEFLKKYLKEKKINVSIYNATNGGMLEVFERRKLSNIIGSKNKD